MSAIDSVSSARRPMRSPTDPSTRLPIGRAPKPIAKATYVFSVWTVGFEFGKKFLPISFAKYPNTAKSNHSRTLPIRPANAVRTGDWAGAASPAGAGAGEEIAVLATRASYARPAGAREGFRACGSFLAPAVSQL